MGSRQTNQWTHLIMLWMRLDMRYFHTEIENDVYLQNEIHINNNGNRVAIM
jgi:hypothetical protein